MTTCDIHIQSYPPHVWAAIHRAAFGAGVGARYFKSTRNPTEGGPMRAITITSPPSIEQWLEMTDDERRLARAFGWLPPIAGGSSGSAPGGGEGGGSGAGTATGDDAGTGGDDETDDADDNDSDDDSDDSDTDDSDDDDDDSRTSSKKRGRGGNGRGDDLMELKRDEYERLRRIAREKDAEDKKREKTEARAKEAQRKKDGQWEEIVKEKDEQIATVESERDEARYQLDAYKRQHRVTESAKRLGFKDPEDAFRYLSDEDTEDEASTERALKALSKRKSYLVNERKSTGAPVNGAGTTLTMEQIERMSPDEINARWDEVQKVMAGAGQ